MDATLKKFGYPGTLIKEYEHWLVLLRPQQVTLGSLILIEKSGQTRFSDLHEASFAEFGRTVKAVEKALATLFAYDKINYLMLMMVDPEVHFHVIPRYATDREFSGIACIDAGWPKLPDLGQFVDLTESLQKQLIAAIHSAMEKNSQ